VGGQPHAPSASTPGKDPVPIIQEAEWAPETVCSGGKSRPHRDSIPNLPARRDTAVLFSRTFSTRWGGGSAPRPIRLYPGKDPVPIIQEAGWAPETVWTGGKSRSHRDSIPDRPARSRIAVLFSRTFSTRWGEGVSTTPRPPLPQGNTRYLLYRRLGGPQRRSGEAEHLVPTGIRSRTVQPVAQSLYRLSYPAHTFALYSFIFLRQWTSYEFRSWNNTIV